MHPHKALGYRHDRGTYHRCGVGRCHKDATHLHHYRSSIGRAHAVYECATAEYCGICFLSITEGLKERTVNQSTIIILDKGEHDSPEDGLCLMEAVAFMNGLAHTDQPPCVSPVLGCFGRNLNDALPQDTRQQLVPFIPLLSGTAGDGKDEERSYLALDWLIRTWLPAWLELSAECREDAARLRELGQLVDQVSVDRAAPLIRNSREHAAAAWAAAWAVVWDAVWDAAGAAAGAAVRAAAGAAVRDAVWDALKPTVETLQESAIDLYRLMINPVAR